MGLLKMDFLGLTTLTVIDDALRLIESSWNRRSTWRRFRSTTSRPIEQVFHRALTSGVFQFESGGMRDVLRRYKPDHGRGPDRSERALSSGTDPGRHDRRLHRAQVGTAPVEYELPELEALLRETLGVIVYQEQVMQISNVLAGYSLGEADLLRRAMGKKDAAEMAKQRERFVQERAAIRASAKTIAAIFDLMEHFAGYGFNKSHSAAYALLAYHTACSEDALPGGVHGGAADL